MSDGRVCAMFTLRISAEQHQRGPITTRCWTRDAKIAPPGLPAGRSLTFLTPVKASFHKHSWASTHPSFAELSCDPPTPTQRAVSCLANLIMNLSLPTLHQDSLRLESGCLFTGLPDVCRRVALSDSADFSLYAPGR